jgi:hypothetical protein
MSFSVEIKKVSQDMSLETGETENFVILSLPNGSLLRAKVNDEAAQTVLDCFVNGANSTRSPINQEDFLPMEQRLQEPGPAPNGFHHAEAPDGTPVLEFGGAPQARVRARHVAADAAGNPIVGNEGFDPGERGSEADEDGVGQV